MFRVQSSIIALTASVCLLVTVSATAEGRERHHRHHHHHRLHHHAYRHHGMSHASSVIGRTALGDVIISGRTGMHRSAEGVMVPDAPGGDLDDAGRIGANGTVGVHVTGH